MDVAAERSKAQMTVPELIKKTRTEENMTQEQYGLKFGVTRQTVSSWENGKSMPDLQMLIDICNTYHISLDKLLNENHDFVRKIDFCNKLIPKIKYIVLAVIMLLIIYGIVVIRWKIKAKKVNETFVTNAIQAGFVEEDRLYVQNIDGVHYWLPHCELSFLEDEFHFEHAYAEDETRETEISITYMEEERVLIRLDHDESMEGVVNADGECVIDETTMSKEDERLYKESEVQIQKMIKQLRMFYHAVY